MQAVEEKETSDKTTYEQMRIVIVGHVDHGKSTLIGRLIYDTGSFPEDKYAQLQQVAEDQGKDFEFSFLLDALEEERDQGITIDTTQILFKTARRQYVIIDAPGHKEFLKNMVTGAVSAGAALLLIAADEGVQEQLRRHGYLLSLLGIKQIVVVVNKMDLVDYDQKVYDEICAEYTDFLGQIRVKPAAFIPAAALPGDVIANKGENMPWYDGPTVLETLDSFSPRKRGVDLPFRLPVQDVYKFDKRRIIAGRVESGRINKGDRILFQPSGKTAEVSSCEVWNADEMTSVIAGDPASLTLDDQLFIERGEVGVPESSPMNVGRMFRANLFWLGGTPLETGKKYILRLVTQEVEAEVYSIQRVVNSSTLKEQRSEHNRVEKNEVAEITMLTKKTVAFDLYTEFADTGRFVLIDDFDTAGGGIILAAVDETSQFSI